jgi:hypothetical protein
VVMLVGTVVARGRFVVVRFTPGRAPASGAALNARKMKAAARLVGLTQ